MNQPKTYCIFLPDHPVSLRMAADCLDSANKFNWKIEPFWGYSKYEINDEIWNYLNLKKSEERKFVQRPGAQGCFLSHYFLWQKISKSEENAIILEHDAIITDHWNEIEINFDIIKLHKPRLKYRTNLYTGKYDVGSHGYLITPKGAIKLIDWAKNNFAYFVDVMIGDSILFYKNLDYNLISLNQNNISTITEK